MGFPKISLEKLTSSKIKHFKYILYIHSFEYPNWPNPIFFRFNEYILFDSLILRLVTNKSWKKKKIYFGNSVFLKGISEA